MKKKNPNFSLRTQLGPLGKIKHTHDKNLHPNTVRTSLDTNEAAAAAVHVRPEDQSSVRVLPGISLRTTSSYCVIFLQIRGLHTRGLSRLGSYALKSHFTWR